MDVRLVVQVQANTRVWLQDLIPPLCNVFSLCISVSSFFAIFQCPDLSFDLFYLSGNRLFLAQTPYHPSRQFITQCKKKKRLHFLSVIFFSFVIFNFLFYNLYCQSATRNRILSLKMPSSMESVLFQSLFADITFHMFISGDRQLQKPLSKCQMSNHSARSLCTCSESFPPSAEMLVTASLHHPGPQPNFSLACSHHLPLKPNVFM